MMDYETHNDIEIDIWGSFLQDKIEVSYEVLCHIFGEPCADFDADKIDAEWRILFEDGKVATIYNWLASSGKPAEYVTQWNVGGEDKQVVWRIEEIIKNYIDRGLKDGV